MRGVVDIALVNTQRGGIEVIERNVSSDYALSYCQEYNTLAVECGSERMALIYPSTINATINDAEKSPPAHHQSTVFTA